MEIEEERRNNSALLAELVPQIHNIIAQGVPQARHKQILEKALQIPELQNSPEMHYKTRAELITDALKQSLAVRDISQSMNLTPGERYTIAGSLYTELTNAVYQFFFFKEIFDVQAGEAQKALYSAKINSMEIVSCFAQTQLGHGSFVRGIETRATYEPEFDGFIINSPSITSIKWWIGALGVGCNYALLIARLIIDDTDYGPHPFFVQLRDLRTHAPLPGISIGDVGPKVGLNGNDNGYLKFEFVKVPREALLNRFANVKKGGEYEIVDPSGIKVLYFSLLKARAAIVRDSWFHTMIPATIATRYSIGRRQFPDPSSDGQELQLIDYQIQQQKLFPGIATGYAAMFAGQNMMRMLEASQNSDFIDDLHGIVSMYKSCLTDRVVRAQETFRRSCGGHGYMTSAGFQQIISYSLAITTYDGDNSILGLQTAKYIMKMKLKALEGHEMKGRYAVLSEKAPNLKAYTDAGSLEFHDACLSVIAHSETQRVFARYQKMVELKTPGHKIWNSLLQIEGLKVNSAFFSYCLHRDFIEGMQRFTGRLTGEVLENLRRILAIKEIFNYDLILLESGVEGEMLDKLQRVLEDSLKNIRPHALGLVEAFELQEAALNSTLGRRDGKFYEEMVRQTKYLNPLNRQRVLPAIERYLRPRL